MRGWTMIAAGAALLGAAACGRSPAGTAPGEIAADASQVTYDMNMKMTEEGVLKADLYADTATTPVGDTRTQLSNVRLTFFNPGKAPGKLTSAVSRGPGCACRRNICCQSSACETAAGPTHNKPPKKPKKNYQ